MPIALLNILDAVEDLQQDFAGPARREPLLTAGSPHASVVRAGWTVDPAALAEAPPVDALLGWQPLFEDGPAPLRVDSPTGRLLTEALRQGTALLACREVLLRSRLAPARLLAEALNLHETEDVRRSEPTVGDAVKYAVFVPAGYEDAVIKAIHAAGGGVVGDYSHCTFRTPGAGTFIPLEGADPWRGEIGRLEQVEEVRLESRVPRERLTGVVDAVKEAHPYEEVAWDAVPLIEPGAGRRIGVHGVLPQEADVSQFAALLADALQLAPEEAPRLAAGREQAIRRVGFYDAGAPDPETARRLGLDVVAADRIDPETLPRWRALGVAVVDLPWAPWRRLSMRTLARTLEAEGGVACEALE